MSVFSWFISSSSKRPSILNLFHRTFLWDRADSNGYLRIFSPTSTPITPQSQFKVFDEPLNILLGGWDSNPRPRLPKSNKRRCWMILLQESFKIRTLTNWATSLFISCGHRWDSNPRQPDCQSGVLPTELLAQFDLWIFWLSNYINPSRLDWMTGHRPSVFHKSCLVNTSGTRIHDNLIANQVFFQLNYCPKVELF